ncbi:Uncharacterized conserved protein YecE, DUF72 family [Leifsonia sp. 98AMF]|uniref:DUF72 domain-containing protein n=1 Tax=unclassified Leifsonia TaxID=2663824 RepID=UPI00087B07E2|nr:MULTISPECIES: DUF72 domain-containing protein [unclassified Leifsonia]SDH43614.1 Uncharacterized conserved protein YecE, DUF72 family [Leifsonia sp. 197AMF]SDI93476.1 Uncharacterized conserved protein YecE, DUF72 family [Leifsonia sp. 466MF]SDJ84847.1 Uncharacterized conserved protein YecE, DUF72 family [Leifsonia sp. 157MF]SDN97244.1 Uncharacterized conserved protein YecE, DUF72 family [Leifsonia sp. 509MF]SEN08097.1 Uncharacterized conserved protein YecE, DUF72 family [Leifsonia sp. 467MF
MAFARIGISGWTYAPWRGVFYPPKLPHRLELEYAAERLDSIEINGSFYSLQRPTSYRTWAERTPDEFVFSVKGGRYITHILRLKNARGAVANFFASGVLALGPKLGPLLWQLPPTLQFEAGEVDAFLGMLPRTTTEAAALARETTLKEDRTHLAAGEERPLRHAVEVRHASFDVPEFAALARAHGVAIVLADTAGRYPVIRDTTADFVYVRLHGDEELYTSGYTDESLDRWAAELSIHLAQGRDVYAYFDNDVKVRAPYDAMGLRDRLSEWTPRPH